MELAEENILNDSEEIEIVELNQENNDDKKEGIKFWYRENDKIKIEQRLFVSFLASLGIRKYFLGKDCIVVQINNNIVKEIETVNIKDMVMNYLDQLDEEPEEGIRKEFIQNKVIAMTSQLFNKQCYEFLPSLEGEFIKDTYIESYIFFKNGFVRVTKNGYKIKDYNELNGLIWENQKIEKNFSCDEMESEFMLLCERICGDDKKRYYALISAMGYLMQGYQNPAKAKAIIFMDEKIDIGSNGGSGKSLVGTGIGHVRKTIRYGKNFSFDRFSYQAFEPGTYIMEFNDIRKNFSFEMLFTNITDNIVVEKKNKNQIILPLSDAPKILISTNHAIKGIDESTLRREFIIEFSDHYNMRHTPEDEFNKRFFDDWNEEEWNIFFNSMIRCIQFYLANGLLDYDRINLNKKNLAEHTSEDFIEFMTEKEIGIEYNKSTIHKEFVEIYKDYDKLPQKTFTEWIKAYAKMKGYKYSERKSNKERFLTLTTKQDERTKGIAP